MTIMQLISGVGIVAGILNVIFGIHNRDKWLILFGIAIIVIEGTYLVGTL